MRLIVTISSILLFITGLEAQEIVEKFYSYSSHSSAEIRLYDDHTFGLISFVVDDVVRKDGTFRNAKSEWWGFYSWVNNEIRYTPIKHYYKGFLEEEIREIDEKWNENNFFRQHYKVMEYKDLKFLMVDDDYSINTTFSRKNDFIEIANALNKSDRRVILRSIWRTSDSKRPIHDSFHEFKKDIRMSFPEKYRAYILNVPIEGRILTKTFSEEESPYFLEGKVSLNVGAIDGVFAGMYFYPKNYKGKADVYLEVMEVAESHCEGYLHCYNDRIDCPKLLYFISLVD